MTKQDIKVIDFIVISIMDKKTGDYNNKLITNRPRWTRDIEKSGISSDDLVRIEIFKLGDYTGPMLMFCSLEEFEDAINI